MSGFFSRLLAKIGLRGIKKENEKIPEKQSPQNKERQIRVFISSTFRDMKDERDILIKKIFPQLRKLCEERAVTWTEVDLRWGITTEEAAEGKVLPLCLAEIHRCRPYFIGLLGERYGWVPESIPADLLESQAWLKEHLQHSVTELEILHGVFSEEQMHGHAYFYFRDPKYLESVPDGRRQDFIPESAEAAGKLVKLKQKIRIVRDEKICELREGYANPEQLGEWILEDFTALIDRLYPKDKIPDPLDQEALRHEAYAQSRRLAFVGRSDLLRQMDDHAGTAGAKPLVLTGESGCGKSALLAEWVARWRMENPEDLIIQHYTGSTPESADWQGLVRRILGEFKRTYAITDELPMQPDALHTALQDWLVRVAGSRRVVIVLDALNQLSGGDASARQLGWLPFALPPNVQLIVSSLPGESLDALRKRGWKELAVPLFARDDIAPAARAYFDIFSKKLPNEILAKIENTAAAANALYLRAVLDELRQFGIHEELEAKASVYLSATDLQTLFDRILTRWHEDFGQDREHPDLVRRSLCLIACSRFGLSEAELLDLLGMKNADGKYEPLPRRPWTPFYLAAENALAQRAGLLTFGHDYLRSAVMRRYLADDAAALHFQLQLAGYFGSIPEPTERKLDELPALLRDTGQWGSLKELLADLPTFERLRERRWIWELHGFWLAIGGRFDPVEVYRHALSEAEPTLSAERLPHYLSEVAYFHLDAGRYEGAEPLFRRALEGRERVLGKEHPDTLTSVNNLAALLYNKGDYEGAEPLFHRALEGICKVSHNMGRAHADLKIFVNNYADCLRKMGMNGVQVRQRLEAVLKPYGFTQVINIIDSVVQRTGFQMGEGDNAQVNVRDSVVQRSNFGEKIDENVQFTVYRPKIVHPQKWYPLLAFAHLSDRRSSAKYDEPDPIKEVQKQAEQILNENIEEYQDIIQDSRQSIPHKRELTFVPDIPGIEFNPPRRSFLWEETVHREEFRLRALSEMDGHICRGCITVFLGSIILAEIGLSIHVDSRHIFRSQNTAMEIENALPYRKIFVSYSHKDLKIVEQIKQYALALGDEYLQDLTHLSAGEVWNEQLKQMINEANIFQLFWSTNSMYSRFVKYEWEYALSLGRPNFIRPVHWEVPLPNCPEKNLPPDELLRLHFQRICYNMELTTELVTSEQITPKIDESSINQIPGEEGSHETPVSMTKKIKLKDEIERREIERDSIEAEQGIELLRKLKGIKREDAASYQEIEERKLKARSGATDEALISTVGKDGGSSPAISHLGELARMKAAKGLTHEQILALQVKESAAAAEALKAKSVEKTEQLYRERARAAEEEINKSRKESEEQEKFQRQLKEEEDRAKIFKKWTILASGTGAGRIASLYFTKMKNVAIGDRILLMNSNRADIINTLLELEKKAVTEEEKALIKQIHERNTLLFGGGGAGNVYKEGEENARKDFETKIRRPIEALKIGANDVILDIVALGGGTGNGSIPYIIHQMKHGTSASLQNHIHVALAILPYSTEPDQRQFNAICGLSRLLKFGDNSQQNADMVLMVDNSKIASDIEKSEGIEPTFSDINKRIIQAIDLLISPGSYTKGVVDIKDYIKFPSMMNMYHFTPCLSTDNDINLIRLDVALDAAVNNSFVKMDPKTAVIGYLIMSIPEKYLNKGDFTEDEVNNIFDKWKKDNIIGKIGFVSIAYNKSKKDTFDVLLLLGGFSLKQTLEKPWQNFKSLKKTLLMASEVSHIEVDNVKLSVEEIERIEGNLNTYINHTEKAITEIKTGGGE